MPRQVQLDRPQEGRFGGLEVLEGEQAQRHEASAEPSLVASSAFGEETAWVMAENASRTCPVSMVLHSGLGGRDGEGSCRSALFEDGRAHRTMSAASSNRPRARRARVDRTWRSVRRTPSSGRSPRRPRRPRKSIPESGTGRAGRARRRPRGAQRWLSLPARRSRSPCLLGAIVPFGVAALVLGEEGRFSQRQGGPLPVSAIREAMGQVAQGPQVALRLGHLVKGPEAGGQGFQLGEGSGDDLSPETGYGQPSGQRPAPGLDTPPAEQPGASAGRPLLQDLVEVEGRGQRDGPRGGAEGPDRPSGRRVGGCNPAMSAATRIDRDHQSPSGGASASGRATAPAERSDPRGGRRRGGRGQQDRTLAVNLSTVNGHIAAPRPPQR